MEQYITQYFKDASHSKDQNELYNYLGCKLVSDSIQSEEEFQKVVNQKFLIQHMIISVPIFGQHIELIIESTLEFYNKNNQFMMNFWNDLAHVAQLNENQESEDDNEKISSIDQLVMKKKHRANLFCDKIQDNMVEIKIKSLKYVELFINYIQKNEELQQNLNIFSIFLLYIQSTSNETLIQETCKVLERAKSLFTYQCFKSDIYTQIELFLMKKLQNNQKQSKFINLESTQNHLQQASHNIHNRQAQVISNPGFDDDDVQSIQKDSFANKQQLVKNLEIWLQSSIKDKIKIAKSEFIQSFLKENFNLEIYFQMFIDPYYNVSSNEFKHFFQHMLQKTSIPDWVTKHPKFRQNKDFVAKSYKVLLSFIDPDNFTRLEKVNPQITNKTLYNILQEIENRPYIPNVNHIVMALRHIIFQSRNSSNNGNIIEFCKNNFIFKFIEFLDFTSMKQLLLDLFGVTNKCICGSNQIKFWKYLQTTGFFFNLSQVMLNQDFQNTSLKFDSNFMMTDVKIDLRNEKYSEEYHQLFELQQGLINYNKVQKLGIYKNIYEDFDIGSQDIDYIQEINKNSIFKNIQTLDENLFNNNQDEYFFKNSLLTRIDKFVQKLGSSTAKQKFQARFMSKGKTLVQGIQNMARQKLIQTKKKVNMRFYSPQKKEIQFKTDIKNNQKLNQSFDYQEYKTNQVTPYSNQNDSKKQSKQKIYPFSINEQFFCEIKDKKVKQFSNIEIIQSYEDYSIICADMFQQCIQKLLTPKYEFMVMNQIDDSYLKNAIFNCEQGKVYQNILENYLFKFELNYCNPENNSSQVCGQIVNLVLQNLDKLDKEYFNMVNSLIVQNMENDLDNKTFVKLQNLGFKTGLKPSSLMMIETFQLIISNSKNIGETLSLALIPTWDVLISLFYNLHVNSIYNCQFINILRLVADHGDEAIFFNIFIKLNLFSKFIYNFRLITQFQTIYCNQVLLTEYHVNEKFVAIIEICEMFYEKKAVFNFYIEILLRQFEQNKFLVKNIRNIKVVFLFRIFNEFKNADFKIKDNFSQASQRFESTANLNNQSAISKKSILTKPQSEKKK